MKGLYTKFLFLIIGLFSALGIALTTFIYVSENLQIEREGLTKAKMQERMAFEAIYTSMQQGGGQEDINKVIERLRGFGFFTKFYFVRGEPLIRQFGMRQPETPSDEVDSQALTGKEIQLVRGKDDYRLVRYVTPVAMQIECQNCHRARIGEILGVVSSEISLQELDRNLRQRRNLLALVIIGGVFILSLSTFLALKRMVILPLQKIKKGVKGIASGDLKATIPSLGQDEIGELGRGFEEMREKLARWGEALQESEGRYRSLVETARDVILTVSPDRIIISLSAAFETITGWSRVDWIGKPFNPLAHPDDLPLANERFQRCLREENNPPYELRILCKSGAYKIGEFAVTPLIRDRRVISVLATVRDITERKQAEEEKRSLEEQLRQSQKMEAIGQLAAGIAHDFNNLLNIMGGYSQLALMDLKEGDRFSKSFKAIENATTKAANLVRQILAFSRRQAMEMIVLDLNNLLRGLEKMLHRIIGEDIELFTVLADALGRVKADPGQIEQVVFNLAINARDAMPQGGKLTMETANVELDEAYARRHVAVIPGRYVMIAVSDTGAGMTPEVRDRVFEPFFTTKEKGKGTGLGLSTVYGIVKQSGGNIWVYSEPGQGTTFKIYLPRVDKAPEEIKRKAEGGELPQGWETILVAEDEEEVRKLAVLVLQKQGYRVLEAAQGGDAFLICEQHKDPIHLLLTDVVMPRMSGRELAERLASLHPEMKVLYMSGYADNAIVHHGVLEEGVNFIPKPFTLDGLARKVREVLDKG